MAASTSRAPVAKALAESPRNNPVGCGEGPAPAGFSFCGMSVALDDRQLSKRTGRSGAEASAARSQRLHSNPGTTMRHRWDEKAPTDRACMPGLQGHRFCSREATEAIRRQDLSASMREMSRQGKAGGLTPQPMTDAHVPVPAKPSTTATKTAASIVVSVQAVGSMWITPILRPKSSGSPRDYRSQLF